jgi:hypothetical protein
MFSSNISAGWFLDGKLYHITDLWKRGKLKLGRIAHSTPASLRLRIRSLGPSKKEHK